MTRVYHCVALILLSAYGYSQARSPLSAASSVYASGQEDIRGLGINTASIAFIEESQVALASERKFMFTELSFYSVMFGLPTRLGNFSMKGDYRGTGQYNESQVALAYGMKLNENIALATGFNYYAIKIAGYGHAMTLGAEAGVLIQVQEKLRTGLQVQNPFGGKFGKYHTEKLPFTCSFGMGYLFAPTCFLSAEIIKVEDQPANGRFALEYQFISRCRARLGFNTAYPELWTGVGFNWKQSLVEFTLSYHAQLGLTPGLVLLYKLKPRTQ